jgi:hypothetical protein
MKKELRI